MDFFTIMLVITVVVSVGAVIHFLIYGKDEEDNATTDNVNAVNNANVDVADVTLLSAGMQNVTLGVAAYTAGTAIPHTVCGCGGNDEICSCVGGDETCNCVESSDEVCSCVANGICDCVPDVDPMTLSAMLPSMDDEDNEPTPALSQQPDVGTIIDPHFHHVDLGSDESSSNRLDSNESSFSHVDLSSSFSHVDLSNSFSHVDLSNSFSHVDLGNSEPSITEISPPAETYTSDESTSTTETSSYESPSSPDSECGGD